MAQKTYINGVFITEKTFADGGSILKLSVPSDKIDALAEQLLANSKDGWTRLVIQRLREPKVNANGKTTATHSLSVDDWQPNQPRSQATPQAAKQGFQQAKAAVQDSDDSIPF